MRVNIVTYTKAMYQDAFWGVYFSLNFGVSVLLFERFKSKICKIIQSRPNSNLIAAKRLLKVLP